MMLKEIEELKTKFRVGDVVIVPKEIAELTHEEHGSQIAEVVGLYRRFFNVKYELGFQQSIQWKDAESVARVTVKGLERAV